MALVTASIRQTDLVCFSEDSSRISSLPWYDEEAVAIIPTLGILRRGGIIATASASHQGSEHLILVPASFVNLAVRLVCSSPSRNLLPGLDRCHWPITLPCTALSSFKWGDLSGAVESSRLSVCPFANDGP